jgi:hypothetical protein
MHNPAMHGTNIKSLCSYSLSLFRSSGFVAQFWDLNPLPYPDSVQRRNIVAYRIADTADSKNKVKEDCFCALSV